VFFLAKLINTVGLQLSWEGKMSLYIKLIIFIEMIKNPFCLLVLSLLFALSSAFIMQTATPYNTKDSKDYAILSGLAYCPKKCLQTWSCKSGAEFKSFGEVSFINNEITLASCFIGYDSSKNQILASFRGSANV